MSNCESRHQNACVTLRNFPSIPRKRRELAITNGLAPRTACDFEARHDSDKSDAGRTKSPQRCCPSASQIQHTYRSTPAQRTKLIVKPDFVLRGRFPLSAHIRQLVFACDEGEAIQARAGRRLYLPAGLSSGRKAFWVGPESTNVVWAYASQHICSTETT